MTVEMQVELLDPPKFKHKKLPRPSGSPPVSVLHSPPRPVTLQDQQDWNIKPSISDWKNPKGYTIPLDKRLACDGRGLEEVKINDNFAKLSESLYVAEEKAREAVAMRSNVYKELMMKEKEKRQMELRELAQKAFERTSESAVCYERLQREKIREERHRKRKLEARDTGKVKKSKIGRDRDRDVSEKVALGMGSTGTSVMNDERLFNQEKGMSSGYARDDAYNVYDKGLFATGSAYSFNSVQTDSETYGGAEEQLEKIMKTDRFKPNKAFSGTSAKAGPRDGLVEFDEADPFGLDQLWK